jgi:predicted acyl esterase
MTKKGTRCSATPPADPSALLAALMGYATVGVNVRGTGCSGGPYDFFEPLQVTDGYDVIETVAAQPWVLHKKVGMTGLSYPGISQLFVAQSQPPGLAAITPLSVIGNTATTLRPGGILNDGFAISWASAVVDKADPYGQGWEKKRVEGGDTVCEENQLLHSQKVDIITKARNTPYFDREIYGYLDPSSFVDKINVPVFMSGSWQDEQTGPFFSPLMSRYTSSPLLRATVTNGVHPDGFGPQNLVEWKAFLDLYVARKVPVIDQGLRDISGLLFQSIFGASIKLPPDRFADYPTHAEALAAFEAKQPIRVIFEAGAGKTKGAPEGVFEARLSAWPPPATSTLRLYFQPDGSMKADLPPAEPAASEFDLDPEAGQRGILKPGGNVWDLLPAYDWKAPADGLVVAFESDPLTEDTLLLGTGSVDIYLRSNQQDADLEANITEVREDGQEVYVQSGWLRASQRATTPQSTELWAELTQEEKDASPLPSGEWTPVRVPIAAHGHIFRKNSRIRVAIDTPGDSRAEWRFELLKFDGKATHQIAHDADHPSSVALPLVTGIEISSPPPACPSLRGQPCRTYAATKNRAASP